jgi:hypothetical protein
VAKTLAQIESLAREHTEKALKTLERVMVEPSAPHAARVSAANSLLDRGWGKPKQAIIGGGADDPAIKVEHIRLIGVRSGDKDT